MDKEEDKETHHLDDPKPESPADSNQNTPDDDTLQGRQKSVTEAFSLDHSRIRALNKNYKERIEAENKQSYHDRVEALKIKYHAIIEALEKNYTERIEDLKKKVGNYEKALKDYIVPCSNPDAPQIDIASGSKEKQVKEEFFDDLKALLDAPVNGNIKQLHERITRFKSAESKRIQGLEAKIHALLHEAEGTDFKNADNQGESKKKNFLDFLKESDERDDGYWALKALKMQATNDGKSLSRLVLNLMFMRSDDVKVMAKFQVIVNALKWVSQGENSVVIKRFAGLLEAAHVKLSKKECKKRKAGMMLEGTEGINDQELEEDVTDEIFPALLKEIFRLELFWMHQVFPDSKMSLMKNAYPLMVTDIEKFGQAMKGLEVKLKSTMKIHEYEAMDLKINELWDQIEESEKESTGD